MDLFFDLLRSVIYGVIEGITEWLPISSTGHMILAEQVLKFSFSAEFMEMFRVVIQWARSWPLWSCISKSCGPSALTMAVTPAWQSTSAGRSCGCGSKIIVACLPAAVLGLALDDWIDAHFYNSVVVAVMLIVYGIAFILIERRPRVPTTTKLSRITYRQALIVGAWQVLALIPGTLPQRLHHHRRSALRHEPRLRVPVHLLPGHPGYGGRVGPQARQVPGGRRRLYGWRDRRAAGRLHRGVCRLHHWPSAS